MEIGKEKPAIIVEPVEDPFRKPEPATAPQPAKAPAPEREKVPA